MPRHAAQKRTKRGGRSVDLIVVGGIGESAEFINESSIPRSLNQLDQAVLALGGKRVGTPFFRSLFGFDRDRVALQDAGEVMGLELAGAARILRDADARFFAIEERRRLHFNLALRRRPAAGGSRR
jgi:hypothetical protein